MCAKNYKNSEFNLLVSFVLFLHIKNLNYPDFRNGAQAKRLGNTIFLLDAWKTPDPKTNKEDILTLSGFKFEHLMTTSGPSVEKAAQVSYQLGLVDGVHIGEDEGAG